jgi:twitching motility protein PilT
VNSLGTAIQQRWRAVVDFVLEHEVSDVSLFRTSVSARLAGQIVPLAEPGALSENEVRLMIAELLKDRSDLRKQLSVRQRSIDFTTTLYSKRFRVNVALAQGELFASLRPLPDAPPPPSEVGLSGQTIKLVTSLSEGLVLISGPTGSGKTTTIACLVEAINQKRQHKIVTIEDPIEFLFSGKQSEIIQREVGVDVESYSTGLREALRQNPDVIVVGEIRDAETAMVALQAAETGHLVIGSVHARSVVETVTRFVLLAPEKSSEEVRYVFGTAMRLIANQRLLRKRQGGRVVVREICVHAPKVESVILSGNEQELENYMLSGRDLGMIDFQTALRQVQSQLEPAEFQINSRAR